jgi:hypothetical protein
MSKLNPRITTIEVGIENLREVTIYPLSLADQGKMIKTLSSVFQSVMESLSHLSEEPEESGDATGTIEKVAAQLSNIDIAETIVTIIQENLESILCLIVAPDEKISMEEVDSDQFYDLVETIYKVNFERAPKNFVALWKGAKSLVSTEKEPAKKTRRKVSHSKKPSPQSADGTTIG